MATKTLHSGNYGSYLYVDYTFTSDTSKRTWTLTASMKFYTGTMNMGPWGDYGRTFLGPKEIDGGHLKSKISSGTTVTILSGATASGTYDAKGTAPSVRWNWEWCVNSEWGGYEHPSGTVTLTGSTISAKSYVVTYDGNGGLYKDSETWVDPIKPTYGSNYTTYSNDNFFVRPGYKWVGWKDQNGTNWTNDVGKAWKWAYDYNVTLFAQWEPYILTINYHVNGADYARYGSLSDASTIEYTGTNASKYVKSIESYYEDKATYGLADANNGNYLYTTRTGYHYLLEYNSIDKNNLGCWNTKADGSGIKCNWGSSSQTTMGSFIKTMFNVDFSSSNKTLDLYLMWEPNTYNIEYNANGGSGIMTNTSCTYDTESILSKNTFSLTGHTLLSWNTEPDGSGIYYQPETTILNLTTQDNDSITLYAIWRVNTLTVNFYANGATTIVTNGVPKALETDLLQTLKYNYTDSNNAAIILPYYNKKSNKQYLQRFGYHYYDNTGVWSLNPDASTSPLKPWGQTMGLRQFFSSVKKLEELEQKDCEINLYCLWQPNKLTIKYVGNKNTEYTVDGITYNEPYIEQIVYDYSDVETIDIKSLDNIKRTGYNNVKKWANETTPVKSVAYGYKTTVHNVCDFFGLLDTIATGNCSIALYNVWDPIDYIVTFDSNGGSGSMSNQIFVFDEPQKLIPNKFTRQGYMFVGWSIDKDVNAENYDFNNEQQIEMSYFSADGSTTQQTLYAIWKAESVNIINKMYVKHTDGNWYGGYLYTQDEQGKWYKAENIHINQNGIWTPSS